MGSHPVLEWESQNYIRQAIRVLLFISITLWRNVEEDSVQRVSSRTLIIDIQWHKKDIIPRYNKYPYSQFRFATTTVPRMNILFTSWWVVRGGTGEAAPQCVIMTLPGTHRCIELIDSKVSNKNDNGGGGLWSAMSREQVA